MMNGKELSRGDIPKRPSGRRVKTVNGRIEARYGI